MNSYNLADWMGELPSNLRNQPLKSLAIPGSHNSGCFSLDVTKPLAPDGPAFLHNLSWLPMVKRVVASWSRSQTLDFTGQLEAGVRYFDLRVASGPQDNKLYLVHGLHGAEVEAMLVDIETFLRLHPREVVLLDFNHFYNMDRVEHQRLLQKLISVFGSKLCGPEVPVATESLDSLLAQRKQVIVFYQLQGGCRCPERLTAVTSATITAPWPNTPSPKHCMAFLDKQHANRPLRSRAGFFVCQGVMTPSTSTVLAGLSGSLLALSRSLSCLLIPWLCVTTHSLNIVIADFVEESEFITSVLDRNFRQSGHEIRSHKEITQKISTPDISDKI